MLQAHVEHINSIDSIKKVEASSHSAHYWQSLLTKVKDQLLRNRQGQAADAKKKHFKQSLNSNSVQIIDQSYFERTFKPTDHQDHVLINSIIEKYTLNKEQTRAFRIIANHATVENSSQLKMYLGGMAGTGKSQVIKSLIEFFSQRSELHRFMCMAPTGSAASLIGGSTYHSILGINPYREKNDNLGSMSDVQNNLKNVNYIFIDEVSMIDCHNLYNISKQMCL
ncbi:hypothetical protein BC629DRAFT_1287276, partial [Irpex lacteus]